MSRKVSNEPEMEAVAGNELVIPLDMIRVDEARNQRRYPVKAGGIKDLAASILGRYEAEVGAGAEDRGIGVVGLINAIVVRELTPEEKNGNEETYELVAGFRRVKALAYLNEQGKDCGQVKATVSKVTDNAARTLLNLSENVDREDVGPIDKAMAIKTLMEPPPTGAGMNQGEVAKAIRKSGSSVSYLLSLLELRPEVQRKINEGIISPRAAREFPSLPEEVQDRLIAEAEAVGGKVGVADAAAARETRGKAKGKARGKKGKGDEGSGAKAISSKQARNQVMDMAKEIEDEEGKRNKTELATVGVLRVFGDYLGGKFGAKAMKNRVMEAVG